jgi:parvulin-like peptidyl-prolyl isomerase
MSLFAAAGCGKKGNMVATVGDQVITVEDFKAGFGGQGQAFDSFDSELGQRKQFLDGMIDEKLLLIGAYEQKLDTNNEIQTLIEQQKGKFLLDQLYQREIVDKVEVAEPEVKAWYENSGEEVHARHILLATKAEADSVRAALDGGADFAQLARENSKDPSAAQNAGDLSWFRWGAMVAPFQEAAFALAENEVSQPVQTDFGWHVIQLLGRRQVDRQPYEQAKTAIEQMLAQQKTQTRLREFLTALKTKAEMRLDPEQLALVRETYRDTTGPLAYSSNLDPQKIGEKQRTVPIIRYLDTSLATGDFVRMANQVPPMNRPNFEDTMAIKEFAFQMIYVPILEREARRLRVDQSDEYKHALQQFRETLMADKMRNDLMQRPVDISAAEARAYYDEHPEEFSAPPEVRVREALVNSQKEAEQIVERVRRGAKFEDICEQVTVRPTMKAKKGDLGSFRRFQYPNLFDAAQTLRVGEVGGPIYNATKTGGQYSVIQVMSKQDAVIQTFEEVEDRIIGKLKNDKRSQTLQEWLVEKREKVAVQVNDEALAGTIDKTKYPEKG